MSEFGDYNVFRNEMRNDAYFDMDDIVRDEFVAHIIHDVANAFMNDDDMLNMYCQHGMRAYAIRVAFTITNDFYISDSQYDEISNPADVFDEMYSAFVLILDDMDNKAELIRNALYAHLSDMNDSNIDDIANADTENRIRFMHADFANTIHGYIKMGMH